MLQKAMENETNLSKESYQSEIIWEKIMSYDNNRWPYSLTIAKIKDWSSVIKQENHIL